MPRDGSGRSHNEVDDSHDIVHGAGDKDVCEQHSQCVVAVLITNDVRFQTPASSGVDRSSKAVPPPEPESGNALEGMGASGGGDKTTGSGKGPVKPSVDEEAEKAGK
jgi:hypothetical protein